MGRSVPVCTGTSRPLETLLLRLELCDKTFYQPLKFSEPSILTQHYDYEYQDDDFQYPENHDNYYSYDYPDSKADKIAETIHRNMVSF